MPLSPYKVIPTIFNKKKEACCICLEKKKDCIKCENPKCSDGIICLSCVKKMTEEQRKKCQICREETEIFKIKPVNLVTDIEDQHVIVRNKKKYVCPESIQICLCAIFIGGSTYGFGILTMYLITNDNIGLMARSSNPVLFMVIGGIVVLCILAACCGCYIKFRMMTR